MKSRSAHNDNRSIRTFFIYAAIVLGVILISLSVRAYYLFQQSKFDGKQEFVIAFGQDEHVEKIMTFDPDDKSGVVVDLKGEPVRFSSLGRQVSILPNAVVTTNGQVPLDEDVSHTMQALLFNYYTVKTNLTIFDVIKLFFVSRKPALTTVATTEITVSEDEEENSRGVANLFIDDAIFSENVSIQVVNASGISGMGRRLERVLINRGANVVSVTTSRDLAKSSNMQYFGEETYTLKTLKQMLQFPVEIMDREGIADIIITIGEDQKNSSSF